MTTQQHDRRYKVFLTNGTGDFLRTPMGQVRLFTDTAEAQAAAVAFGGGMVLPHDAPAPGGFDRMWEP